MNRDQNKEDNMGFGEMLGVKVAKLNLKGNYETMEQLYEAIKDIKFEAGTPALVKHGFNQIIVYPQQDRNNQVWIMNVGKGKYQVMRSSEVAGPGKVVEKAGLGDLTDGGGRQSGGFWKKKKNRMGVGGNNPKKKKGAGG